MTHARHLGAVLIGTVVFCMPAHAVELLQSGDLSADAGGHLKLFSYGVFPQDNPALPNAFGMALLDTRLKLEGRVGNWLSTAIHPILNTTLRPSQLQGGSLLGVGQGGGGLPEAIQLSRTITDTNGFLVTTRIDRAVVTLHLPHVDVSVGRQPVTFGQTYFFTPMDLVAPFSPVVVDRQYKPGVDSVRADVFMGTSTKTTLVAAYAGAWNADGLIVAGHSTATFFGVDVGVLIAAVRRDVVLGMDASGDLFGFALRAEGTLTAHVDKRPFARLCLGVDRRFDNGLTLSTELYTQTLGAGSPSEYLAFAQDPHVARGELWALGRYYAALSASFELLPILHVTLFSVANLQDPSFLVGPSLLWSVADEVEVTVGSNLSLGAHPDLSKDKPPTLQPHSEFGMYPNTAYATARVFF